MKSCIFIALLALLHTPLAMASTGGNCSDSMTTLVKNAWKGNITKELIDLSIATCQDPANDGDTESQYALSVLHLIRNNEIENEQSYLWTRKAASNNHVYAQYRLGRIYETGVVIPKDSSKADKWYTKAAENGLVLAQRKLGDNYTTAGQEKAVFMKGLFWYEQAADQGDKLSVIRLMDIFTVGTLDFPANKGKADYWEERYELLF